MTDTQPAADPSTLDELRRQVASATGAAQAGVDVAEHGTRHTARQIVYALAEGAAEDLALRPLLRELATESERLSGEAVRLHSRFREAERAASAAAKTGDANQLTAALAPLQAVHAAGVALHARAETARRRLPRAYGDPLKLDREWSA